MGAQAIQVLVSHTPSIEASTILDFLSMKRFHFALVLLLLATISDAAKLLASKSDTEASEEASSQEEKEKAEPAQLAESGEESQKGEAHEEEGDKKQEAEEAEELKKQEEV